MNSVEHFQLWSSLNCFETLYLFIYLFCNVIYTGPFRTFAVHLDWLCKSSHQLTAQIIDRRIYLMVLCFRYQGWTWGSLFLLPATFQPKVSLLCLTFTRVPDVGTEAAALAEPFHRVSGWFIVSPDMVLWTKPTRTRNTETAWSGYSILIFVVVVVTIITQTYFLSMLRAFSRFSPLDWTRITHIMFLVLSFSPPPLPTPRLSLISAHPQGRPVSHAIRIHMLPC